MFFVATAVFVAVLWVWRNPMLSQNWWLLNEYYTSCHTLRFGTMPLFHVMPSICIGIFSLIAS